MRREMENALRAFDQISPSPDIGAGAPAINVAETKDAFEYLSRPRREVRPSHAFLQTERTLPYRQSPLAVGFNTPRPT
jgi:hypothetical protein